MLTHWIILDLATAAIADAANYLTPAADRKPPANYTKPDSIADWQAKDFASDLKRAALDLDLARITAFGCWDDKATPPTPIYTETVTDRESERNAVGRLAMSLRAAPERAIITYGGNRYDLPLLMRRARYLGVEFPALNLDRYRSPHIDLCELLSDRDASRRKSLDWYVRRMGWTDLQPKPMTGEEEARIFEHGDWSRLADSVRRDVEAIHRLAKWAGVLT